MVAILRTEIDNVSGDLAKITHELVDKGSAKSVAQISSDVEILGRKFAENHSLGRWLWRSGRVLKGGFIPLEVQVTNAAPQSLLWKAGECSVTCTQPGLYQVECGIFTQNTAKIELCVSGEPVITMEPGGVEVGVGVGEGEEEGGGVVNFVGEVTNAAPQSLLWKAGECSVTCTQPGLYQVECGIFTQNTAKIELCVSGEPVITMEPGGVEVGVGVGEGEEEGGGVVNFVGEHVKKRNRHSAGDVTCIGVNECMALPANAVVGVRYSSDSRAQGFLSLRKL